MAQQVDNRPSTARRNRLRDTISLPYVSSFFPIERYYDAAETLYEAFQDVFHREPNKLDDAYVYGKRYSTFCLDKIPTHNYYNSPKNKALKDKHTRQVMKVVEQLAVVADRMDQEEIRLEKERQEQEKKKFEELQLRAKRQQEFISQSKPGESVETSAMSKLERLRVNLDTKQEGVGRVNASASSAQPRIRRDPSGEEPIGAPRSRYYLPPDDDEILPPALPPPSENGSSSGMAAPPPPSYNQIISTQRNGRYRPESMMNQGIGIAMPEQPPAKRQEREPMKRLQDMYRDDYEKYKQAGSITIRPLGTYQGRYSNSTNGCTVISALIAAGHLTSRPTPMSDSEIDSIIDSKCGPILRKIRNKLGLGDHALIIPSDVHDQLVDDKILRQDYFVGAAGGNVMDREHMGEFLKLLIRGEDGKTEYAKSAATFFFREHVIGIVKTPVGGGKVEFELVDSLPGASNRGRSVGSRTVCKDHNSLQVLLRWYTSRKFSPSDCSYIDQNEWNDATADVDPRVFQGFVWAVK